MSSIRLKDYIKLLISPSQWFKPPVTLRVRTTDGFVGYVNAWANEAHSYFSDRFNSNGNQAEKWDDDNEITLSDVLYLKNWSDSVWAAIGRGEIIKGMPKDALILNWGNPDDSIFSRLIDSPYVYVYRASSHRWKCYVYIKNDLIEDYKRIYEK